MVKVSLSKALLRRIPEGQPNALLWVNVKSLEEKAKLLVIRDLHRLGWRSRFSAESVTMTPPDTYSKEIIRESMSLRRADHMVANAKWLERMLPIVRENLASGKDVLESSVKPRFEVCKTAKQMALFRALRHYWSSPYTDYVGRRIRIIIRDDGLPTSPVLGIAAIGSSIIHIPERDDWVGWDTQTRSNRIIYTMDAYVLGAIPPYNHLLGGKLVAYMLASNEFRRIYKRKYQSAVTNIKKGKRVTWCAFLPRASMGRAPNTIESATPARTFIILSAIRRDSVRFTYLMRHLMSCCNFFARRASRCLTGLVTAQTGVCG